MSTTYETALARSRAYALLSHLYLRGLTPDVLPQVATIDEFRATLPAPYDSDLAAGGERGCESGHVEPGQTG